MEHSAGERQRTETVKRSRYMCLCSLTLLVGTIVSVVIFGLLAAGAIETTKDSNRGCLQKSTVQVTRDSYGTTKDGRSVHRFIFKNKNYMEVHVITLGGTMTVMKVPDKEGKIADVALGYENLSGYENRFPFFGALIGRYANRIAYGKFSVNGTTYQTTTNNGNHSLHGGVNGWNKALWSATMDPAKAQVTLSHTSPDGDEGFPGEVKANVTYELTEDNELIIRFRATTTKKATPINLTSHGYYNLAGQGKNIYDHQVTIYADKYPVVGNDLIPTGELKDVSGTLYDLRAGAELKETIFNVSGGGYDNSFALLGPTGRKLAAKIYHPPSGRLMEVFSNQATVQFYTGNFLNVNNVKGGVSYGRHAGFCMDSQNYPDAPNQPNFPDSILRPGSTYNHQVSYKFTTA